jgi:hypothetical protein
MHPVVSLGHVTIKLETDYSFRHLSSSTYQLYVFQVRALSSGSHSQLKDRSQDQCKQVKTRFRKAPKNDPHLPPKFRPATIRRRELSVRLDPTLHYKNISPASQVMIPLLLALKTRTSL